MNSERDLFEEWAYRNQWNINRFRDMGIDKYVDDFVDAAWHGWQASTQRQGYKLVPVEPTQKMIEAAIIERSKHGRTDSCIYQAMIGAVDG